MTQHRGSVRVEQFETLCALQRTDHAIDRDDAFTVDAVFDRVQGGKPIDLIPFVRQSLVVVWQRIQPRDGGVTRDSVDRMPHQSFHQEGAMTDQVPKAINRENILPRRFKISLSAFPHGVGIQISSDRPDLHDVAI